MKLHRSLEPIKGFKNMVHKQDVTECDSDDDITFFKQLKNN
jgi:hypothetical protein